MKNKKLTDWNRLVGGGRIIIHAVGIVVVVIVAGRVSLVASAT